MAAVNDEIAPLIKLAASEQRKTAACSMSLMRPKRPSGMRRFNFSLIGSGHKTLHAFRVFDWAGRDGVDADAVSSPLDREIARYRIDSGLCRRDVDLLRRPQVMQRRADVQNRPAAFFQFGKRGATDVERPFQIDVNHRAETVRRKLFRRAEKIPRRAVDHDVQPPKRSTVRSDCALDLVRLSHIARERQSFAAARVNHFRAGSRCSIFRLTSATRAPLSASARATPPVIPVPPPVTNATRPASNPSTNTSVSYHIFLKR